MLICKDAEKQNPAVLSQIDQRVELISVGTVWLSNKVQYRKLAYLCESIIVNKSSVLDKL